MPDFEEYTQHNVVEARAVLEALSTDPARRTALVELCQTAHSIQLI
jgi:hypothetical protein